jgi:cellulose synthase/poly-beta-1,6-N-acetylglucosamine synthase-like glycosyltransferase
MEAQIAEAAVAFEVRKVTLPEMLFSNKLPTRSVILRREITLRFPENTLSEDYSLWLRIIAAGYDVRLMNYSLAFTFRPEYSEGGSSAQLWVQERGELQAFLSLYQGASIHFLTFLISCSWSILKFIRRFIIRASHI